MDGAGRMLRGLHETMNATVGDVTIHLPRALYAQCSEFLPASVTLRNERKVLVVPTDEAESFITGEMPKQ